MGQTNEADMNLYERIEFVRGKVKYYETMFETSQEGSIFGASDEDIENGLRMLAEYARELDALESYAMDIQAERNGL